MRYKNLQHVYLSFCWYVLLHNVSSPLHFSDVQNLGAYLKRREFKGILGPTVAFLSLSKKISNDQELIQSDPISCPQNQKGNN